MTENCTVVEAIHRLSGMEERPRPAPRLLDPYPIAARATRHLAYQALLEAAGLSDAHREALLARGLSLEAIEQAGYASMPRGSRAGLLSKMQEAIPDLRGVPGVSHRPDRNRWRLAGAPGLLVPVRDRRGHIQACQVRSDSPGSRYQWLTSAPHEPGWTGTSPGTPFHVAGQAHIRRSATWWLTEGPLKADVTSFFVKAPVMGIPGVSLWARVGQALSQWHPGSVILAFDQDSSPDTRARVAQFQEQLGGLLAGVGIRVFIAHWPEGPKGIDDALQSNAKLKIDRWKPEVPGAAGI